ncbi:MAG: LarC family nickel insertion protein, partial [Firmicutes bacterium]|nr:LarC family nickel insertion protein [Bacillota bacterium]
MEAIDPDRVIISPVNTGSGSVKCAHGILPVPAPATAEILKGIPSYSDGTQGELCTPTGAALLAHFAVAFGPRPLMQVEQTGIGLGTKDFPKANILRVFLGEEMSAEESFGPADGLTDRVCELSANIDDMTGEELGFALEQLMDAGALDVYYVPIIMKKSRPAVKLSVLCTPEEADRLAQVMFRYTKTAGIRRQEFSRYVLDRRMEDDGGITVKTYSGYGVKRSKAEYEDLARRARETGKALWETE